MIKITIEMIAALMICIISNTPDKSRFFRGPNMALVILLYKNNERNKSQNRRPVSILSGICVIVSQIYLTCFVKFCNSLHKFMQSKSCPQKAPERLEKVVEIVLMDFLKASTTLFLVIFFLQTSILTTLLILIYLVLALETENLD